LQPLIERAFDSTSHNVIIEGAKWHGLEDTSCQQISRLNENGCYTLEYVDDITILINGKFPNIVSELLQEALGTVQQWCDRTQLSINPQKMTVSFRRKGA
jgi:hypothetical protein